MSAPPPPPPAQRPQDAGDLALLAHLSALVLCVGIPSFIGPLVVWLWKRDEDPFVAEHAREALNFNLSALLYATVGVFGGFVFLIVTVGLGVLILGPLAAGLVIAWFVLVIVAGVEASKGRPFRYPLTIRFVR